MSNYRCVCGREFDKPNSFNGHKSNCLIHLESTGKLSKKLETRELTNNKISRSLKQVSTRKKQLKLKEWIDEQHRCEHCNKIMTEFYGSGRFCCRSCSNSKPQSESSRNKIQLSVKKQAAYYNRLRHETCVKTYNETPAICKVCGKTLSYDNRHKSTCGSTSCIEARLRAGGIHGVQSQGDARRSKNEIYFAELCKSHFNNVETNVPIFQGWDADVIIHDHKLAILWNGSWHFDKITVSHSVEQVQTRDRLKIQAIQNCGYNPYIIEDHGGFNKKFVEEQFNILINLYADVGSVG